VLGIAAFLPFVDFFALLGTLLWILVASIVLARVTRTASYASLPGPA
jgi:hypothetical protein